MKIRAVLSDSDLMVLADILRSHLTDSAKAETIYYQVLDLEVGTGLGSAITPAVAKGLREGWAVSGLLSALLTFVTIHGQCPGVDQTPAPLQPIPDIVGLPLSPGTDAYDLFFYLYMTFRTQDEVDLRWPSTCWRYFASDRLRPHGYATETDQYGRMRLVSCPKQAKSE